MADRLAPPPGLMERFREPPWKTARLENVQPSWIVEGVFEGYRYTVIQTVHAGISLFSSRNDRYNGGTTFFVIELPERLQGKVVTTPSYPPHHVVAADDRHLYVAALGKRPPIAKWKDWLKTAANAADRMQSAPTAAVGTDTAAQREPRHWNPHDRRWILFWLICGSFPALFVGALWQHEAAQWWNHGLIFICSGKTHVGQRIAGWGAIAYLALLGVPLVSIPRLVWVMCSRIHTRWFGVRLNSEGIALAALSLLALEAGKRLPAWQTFACPN